MIAAKRFESFMRSYQNMVYSTAYRLLANDAEAQDISQEVFLKAYDRFGEIGDSPKVGGWLKAVTRNLCLNHLTRHRRRWRLFTDMRRERSDGEEGEDYGSQLADEGASTAEAGELADQRTLLERAMMGLPRDQRLSLALYHFEDMSYDEIARKLKVSLSKVKTDIMRGRQALKARLEDKREELGV